MVSEVKLIIQNDFPIHGKQVGDYFYDELTDTIAYQLPYFFPCKFAIKRLHTIIVTPAMMKLPYFLKYHNIDQLRQCIHQIHCIAEDEVLLHGSVWKKDGKGFLAVGFPNSGKTTSALKAVADGAIFCADENVILADGIAYPVARRTSLSPWLADLISYPLTDKQELAFFFAKLRAKLFPIFEPNIWVDLPYERFAVKIDEIIYLTDGKQKSLRLLTDNEFPWFTNPLIQTYAYAVGLNLDKIYAKYKKLLDNFEDNIK